MRWYEEFLFTAAAVYYIKHANVPHINHHSSCPSNKATSVRLRQKTVKLNMQHGYVCLKNKAQNHKNISSVTYDVMVQ